MSVPRLHVAAPLAAGASVAVEGERVHYLRHVLRLRDGAEVRAFQAGDGEWRCRISGGGRHRVELRVEERLRAPMAEPGPTLAFAPIKRNRLEWLVEKAVELGAGALVPVLTARTVVRPGNADRLEAIAVEAAEQCERLTVPGVAAPVAFDAWLAGRDPAVPLLFAEERGEGRPILAGARGLADAVLLVGPEGGFTPEERARLHAAPGSRAVSLGPLILRAETAALMALAAWRLAQTDA